jgi:hypothetical protein
MRRGGSDGELWGFQTCKSCVPNIAPSMLGTLLVAAKPNVMLAFEKRGQVRLDACRAGKSGWALDGSCDCPDRTRCPHISKPHILSLDVLACYKNGNMSVPYV